MQGQLVWLMFGVAPLGAIRQLLVKSRLSPTSAVITTAVLELSSLRQRRLCNLDEVQWLTPVTWHVWAMETNEQSLTIVTRLQGHLVG